MGIGLPHHGISPQDGPYYWILAGGSWILFVLLFYMQRAARTG